MIYISTGGYKTDSFDHAISTLSSADITAFELSGGTYVSNVRQKLISLATNYTVTLHNYFPPPKEAFVLNLASMNQAIADASMRHVRAAIDLSSQINAAYYSFHAGYLIDPTPKDLGKRIKRTSINDREESFELFLNRSNLLAAYAESRGVKLLVENNVLSAANFKSFSENPLLMVEASETAELIRRGHPNLGILIDVAHLKVSANTLKFSATGFLERFYDHIEAYHLSDNDGLEDSNEEISNRSWFWDYINPALDYYSIEVYKKTPDFMKAQFDIAAARLKCC